MASAGSPKPDQHNQVHHKERRAKRQTKIHHVRIVSMQRVQQESRENRTLFLVVGDRINYLGEVETPTADMLIAQILFNSLISTRGAKFMTMHI